VIDPDDERTAVSRRAAPASEPDVDERTLPARRSRTAAVDADAPAGLPDDATAVSSRSGVPSDSEVPTQAATESGQVGPRRTPQPAGDESGDSDSVDLAGSRSREAAVPKAPAGTQRPSSPSTRVAAAPDTAAAAYRARPVPQAAATRAEDARRAPQTYVDTAAVEAGRRRHRRRRVLVGVVAASVVFIAAALALAVLLTIG